MLADAHAYQGAGTVTVRAACTAAFGTPIVPGSKARILADGVAAAPADAPAAVQAMVAAGNRINHFPYSYGGAHGDPAQTMSQTAPDLAAFPGAEENGGPGYECSSATDYVLYGGGLGQTLLQDQAPASTTLESVGDPGPGKWVTIYANAGHAYIEVAGIYFDTAAGLGNPPTRRPPARGGAASAPGLTGSSRATRPGCDPAGASTSLDHMTGASRVLHRSKRQRSRLLANLPWVHVLSGSPTVDAVVTRLVLAASRRSVSAPSHDRTDPSVDAARARLWRIPRLAPAAEAALVSRRDEHVGACARTANSTEPTVGVGLLLIPSSRVIGVSTALIR